MNALDRAVLMSAELPPCDMTPNEIEANVRASMHDIDDRAVAFQVAHSLTAGRPSWLMCTCRPSLKTAGPPTLEVHERDEKFRREWPEISAKITLKIESLAAAYRAR
jgi:hypothetical protein